jgi:hypothetical protein
LPTELCEKNKYLTGSYYLQGLEDEIKHNALYPEAFDLIKINPTGTLEMQERLASAAGYLVFRRLILAIQDKHPSR